MKRQRYLPKYNLPIKDRIDFYSMPVPECGCWIWLGHLDRYGYGQTAVGGKRVTGHRMAWAAYFGDIPNGLCVCHRCDTPSCVNPDHLFLGTNEENIADKTAKGRAGNGPGFRGETHPSARFSDAIIAAVRAAFGSQREIAKRFGISPTHVHGIRSGKYRTYTDHMADLRQQKEVA